MTSEIRTETVIDAPPSTVWEVLTDLEGYREWNPQIVAADGDLTEGAKIELSVRPSGGRRRTLTARVETVEPPRRLEWVGRVFASVLFEGRRRFELEALEGDRTRLVNRERFSGVLTPLLVAEDAERDYEEMNRSLARRAEGRAAMSPRSTGSGSGTGSE